MEKQLDHSTEAHAVIIQSDWPLSLDFGTKPIVVEPSPAQLTSDAGLLPIRQFDEAIGLSRTFAAALHDPRDPGAVVHSYEEMVRMRIYGILADYADQNDHDQLRKDPLFKLLAGRSPEDRDLASQPTLSRFENSIDIPSLFRLRDVFIDRFIESFDHPPRRLVFDVDTFDDPTHGNQQLTFFHGYYDQYQYLARVITCAQNDLTVMVSLLYGLAPASLALDRDLEYLVGRLREVWPDVQIASVTTGIWRTSSGSTCMLPRPTCWRECGLSWPTRYPHRPKVNCPMKLWPEKSGTPISTSAVNVIRWVKANPAHGALG